MISSVTPPAEVYLQWNTDYWSNDVLGDSTSRGISPVKHWLLGDYILGNSTTRGISPVKHWILGGWYPRWPHQQRYISSETLTTGRMISAMTPPAQVYLQLNTDYWVDDILGDSTSRVISPVKHWLLGGWYPRWLHQQRYISSETLTTGRMISPVTPPAEVYLQWNTTTGRMISAMTPPAEVCLQWNTDYWEDDILGDSTSRGISPVKHWLLSGWYPRWLHQQRCISSETLTTGRMIFPVTPPAEVYLQWNTDYWAVDILGDPTSRGISPVKHWLLGGWYPRWLHQQRYIAS